MFDRFYNKLFDELKKKKHNMNSHENTDYNTNHERLINHV